MSSRFSKTFGDPARAMTVAADLLSPLRPAVKLIWPMAILAAIAGYNNWYDLTRNLELAVRTFSFWQNLVIGMLTANLLSRLAMGVTMAAHDAPPNEFGIRLLLGLIPRFFIGTGPVRQLNFSGQRRCHAAALLARLSLFWIGVLGWVVLRRGGSGLSDAALVLGATGLGSFLFTANPLFPANGYQWMAAFFRMPDLRTRSYKLLWLVARLKPIPQAVNRREIYGLLAYAVGSIVFTATLLYGILTTVAYLLEQQFRGAGVVMFAVMLSIMLAFVIDRMSNKARKKKLNAGSERQSRSRTMAETSHPAAVSCYNSASNEKSRHDSVSPGDMAHNTARKRQEKSGQSPSSMTGGLDAVLPVAQSGDGRSPADRDGPVESELDIILGPPEKPSPTDEFDELLDAVLEPVALARAPEADSVTPVPASAGDDKPVGSIVTAPRNLPVPVAGTEEEAPALPARRVRPTDAVATPRQVPLDGVLQVDRKGRKRISRTRKLAVWSVILGVLYFVAIQPYPFTVGGDFIIQPVERTQVRARTDGEIVELNVVEGDWVSENQVMAVLSNWDELRDIAIIEAELDRLQADLETLTSEPKPEEIDLAEQELRAAETRMALARQDLERKQQLFETGTVSRKALDEARSNHDLSVAEHAQAKARLDLLKSPASESEVAAAQANIQRKQEELRYSKLQLEHTNVSAPTSGQVVTTMQNMSVGTYLREGDLFAELADDRVVMAEIEVPETEAKEAAIGATVTLKSWSSPNADIVGTVKRLAPVAEEREFGRVLRVIVEVPNPDGRLSQNMTGFGKVLVDERPVWEVFTRVLIRFFQIEIWSWLP